MTEPVYIAIGHGLSILVLGFISFLFFIKAQFLSRDKDLREICYLFFVISIIVNMVNFGGFYFDTLKKALIVSGYIST